MVEEIRQLEVRMLRWSDSSTAGRTATFELDPLDGIEHPLRHFPSGAKNGQRFRVLIAPIADDESSALPDVQEAIPTAQIKPVDPSKSERAKESYRSLDAMGQAVTRASILCKDPAFSRYWEKRLNFEQGRIDRPETCADFMRRSIGIKSRSEIGTSEDAYRKFLDIEHGFAIYRGREPEPR